ncbi:MAG: hypothetical protein H8D45_04200 [Bacteroidetes bacterium]|nr:hypothetical protein [Bacteroidota bacterium]MBL7067314.1 hypothetical protein [Candidatus Neomarinimicrobiota bacterium]
MFEKFAESRIALFAGVLTFILITGFLVNCGSDQAEVRIWDGNTFHQTTINMSKYGEGIVKAKVENRWQEFRVTELPDKFMEWNTKGRLETVERIKKMQRPSLNGPHNAMIASHGRKRSDSQFSINNAVKGTGFIPKKENLNAMIEKLHSTIDSPFEEKLAILEGFYVKCDSIFDRTKLVSLELYSTPEFETQSFLNQMTDPGVAIVYLDIPTFKIKAITQLLHPDDPELTDYEKGVVEYINLIHSYFHGDFPKMFISVLYHVVEVYDSSPGKGGKGIKIVP